MEARFVEFNEALMVLAQGLRDGVLSLAEFRLRRRQLLVALMAPMAASEAGPGFALPSESPGKLPAIDKGGSRRGMLTAVLLLVLLLAVLLFGALA